MATADLLHDSKSRMAAVAARECDLDVAVPMQARCHMQDQARCPMQDQAREA